MINLKNLEEKNSVLQKNFDELEHELNQSKSDMAGLNLKIEELNSQTVAAQANQLELRQKIYSKCLIVIFFFPKFVSQKNYFHFKYREI